MTRTLRSKHARALLYQAANGLCQRCGQPLGDDWEADHIVPWSVSQRTNVHEMQALCRRCNREKGTSMLRRHQVEMERICKEIVAGVRDPKAIIADVVPGGGKQLLAVIAAKHLIGPFADGIVWFVPRKALQQQGAEAFLDPRFRSMIGHGNEIRQGANEYDPSRGLQGYVIPYQSLVTGSFIHQAEMERRRYIAIFDEWHHAYIDGAYYTAAKPIIERCVLPIFMSGTFSRSDNRLIGALPYEEDDGGWRLNLGALSRDDDYAVIRYDLFAALGEKAVKWIDFDLQDGLGEWIDKDGQSRFATVAASGDDARDVIYTVLRSGFARQLFSKCLAHYQSHRLGNARAKMLIVAPTVKLAREYLHWAKQAANLRCEIAVSEEDEEAQANILRYKLSNNNPDALDILATVGMAYEGLDVPAITHIACLTHIRTPEWIGQMIARAWRVDYEAGPYEGQFGMIFAPDDPLMRKIVEGIRDIQDAFVRKFPDRDPSKASNRLESAISDPIIPTRSEITRHRVTGLGTGDEIGYDDSPAFDAAMEEAGLVGIIEPTRLRRFTEALATGSRSTATLVAPIASRPLTAREREGNLRTAINEHCKQYDAAMGLEPRTLNAEIKLQFGKGRPEMTEAELLEVWRWINQHRTIPGGGRG